ncbi:MAG TPA: YcaO-like family protein [Spirillospora sp.]|nr:YcaO-like family protein [Spirillospora sp.]
MRAQVFRPYPGCPRLRFGRIAARSAAFARAGETGGTLLVGAAAGTDDADVAARARAELLERAHNVLAGRRAETDGAARRIATYEALQHAGAPAVDPCAWSELRTTLELRRRPLLWVDAVSLVDGRQVLVPASGVFLRHRPPPQGAAPMRPGSTGIAAHRTEGEASRHALLEVLERDLLWRAWYGRGPRRTLAHPLPEPLSGVLGSLGTFCSLVFLPGPAETGCVVACLHDERGDRQTFGARATATPLKQGTTSPGRSASLEQSVASAVYEALMVRWSMDTADARAARRRMRERGGPPIGPVEHAVYAYRHQDALAHLRAADGGAVLPHPTASPATGPRTLAEVVADHTDEDVLWRPTMAPELDTGDLAVGRVIAPGAHRLPSDEHAHPPPADARTRRPHPLG